ncbi:Fc.00g032790.m01.CDS01 [Cosmosporella sp. VM-42]
MASLPPDRRPIVICGPSGVGKGTLINMLKARHPDTFTLSVSHTTRGPRPGEVDGVNYHFVSREAFETLDKEKGFIEHTEFSGNYYGTSKAAIEEQTKKDMVVVLDIEMEGVKNVKASSFDARYVFVAPPDKDVLKKRLEDRGTETGKAIKDRLDQADKELDWAKEASFDKILINDDLKKAFKELDDWVYQ